MKRKINLNRPQISSEEIAQRKNFESVLKGQPGSTAVTKALLKKPWFLSGVVALGIALIATVLYISKQPGNGSDPGIAQQPLKSDSLALQEFYKAEEAKPCIAPPFEGLNIPYTVFNVIAEKGATLEFKTGSRLIVPKNAFSDAAGNLIKGEVELRYREFHDVVDFIVAGIPMTYDSAGARYHFESAGMMQIEGFQDGKKVNIAEGKKIGVEMASNYEGNSYNLYELDTLKNNWACLGKDKVVALKDRKSNSSKADTAKQDIRETAQYKKVEEKRTEIVKEIEKKVALLPKLAPAPSKPAMAKKDRYTFNLDVDPKEYPELALYKGVLFEVGEETKNFNKSMYNIVWDNATIKAGPKKGENYLILLEKGQQRNEVVVYPVFEGKDYESAMKDYKEKFNSYNTLLDKRKEEEKKIEAQYMAKLAALKKEQEALELKWKEDEAEAYRKLDNKAKVTRMFQVNNFGVYNCDTPHRYPAGVMCKASLETANGRELHVYDIYHIDLGKNAVFTYSRNPLNSFSFTPKSGNRLWTVESGVLYYLEPEDFKDIKNGSEQKLKMKKAEQKFATAEEMKVFFKM